MCDSKVPSALINFLVDYPVITVKEKVFTTNQSIIKSCFNLPTTQKPKRPWRLGLSREQRALTFALRGDAIRKAAMSGKRNTGVRVRRTKGLSLFYAFREGEDNR